MIFLKLEMTGRNVNKYTATLVSLKKQIRKRRNARKNKKFEKFQKENLVFQHIQLCIFVYNAFLSSLHVFLVFKPDHKFFFADSTENELEKLIEDIARVENEPMTNSKDKRAKIDRCKEKKKIFFSKYGFFFF